MAIGGDKQPCWLIGSHAAFFAVMLSGFPKIAMTPFRSRAWRYSSGQSASMHDHSREHIGLQCHQDPDKAGQRDRVKEHKAQNRTFMPEPIGRRRRHHDRAARPRLKSWRKDRRLSANSPLFAAVDRPAA
jgi:hypothetical protein